MWSRVRSIDFDFFRGESGVYFLINAMTALSFSIIFPIMTLFLIQTIGVEPGYIGLYTVGTALSAMVISQVLGALSDRGISSKKLYLVSAMGLIIGGFLFSVITQFWQVLMTGICFMSFGSASISVLLAMIRHFAENSGKNSTKINSQMRASISLLWVIGPTLAFASVDHFGMRLNFFIAGVIGILVLLIALWKLPSSQGTVTVHKSQSKTSVTIPMVVWVLSTGIFFANMANSAYFNAMPLYLNEDLHFPLSFPGLLLGMTAALEVPVMLIAANLAGKYGKIPLMIISFASALCFYCGVQFATTKTAFIALQFCNGLFYGTFVGLGVTLLQDFVPTAVGKVSALYTNAMNLGTMCGSSLMGLVAQYCGFKASLLTSLVSVFVSFVIYCLFYFYTKHHRMPVETSV